jgi:hypothetical protein
MIRIVARPWFLPEFFNSLLADGGSLPSLNLAHGLGVTFIMPLKDQIKNYAKKVIESKPDGAALQTLVPANQPRTISRTMVSSPITPDGR